MNLNELRDDQGCPFCVGGTCSYHWSGGDIGVNQILAGGSERLRAEFDEFGWPSQSAHVVRNVVRSGISSFAGPIGHHYSLLAKLIERWTTDQNVTDTIGMLDVHAASSAATISFRRSSQRQLIQPMYQTSSP